MTAFDIIVLFLLGTGAIFGFMRGFTQEVLLLGVWVLVVAAIRFHAPAAEWLYGPVGTDAGAAVLAFLAIAIVTYVGGRLIARKIGEKSRKSALGPFDRVLGFGFGAVKGLIGATLLFLLLVMVFEVAYGGDSKRPEWMTASRTYPLLNASGDALSSFIRERQQDNAGEGSDAGDIAARPASPKPELYTKDILRLAASLPHADALADADASAARRSQVCGSEMRADVKVENGHLTAIALRGRACAMGQASAAVVRKIAIGRSAEEISNARAALAQALIGQSAFDGCWPELTVFESARAYPARHAAILLPFDAVLVAMTGGN